MFLIVINTDTSWPGQCSGDVCQTLGMLHLNMEVKMFKGIRNIYMYTKDEHLGNFNLHFDSSSFYMGSGVEFRFLFED